MSSITFVALFGLTPEHWTTDMEPTPAGMIAYLNGMATSEDQRLIEEWASESPQNEARLESFAGQANDYFIPEDQETETAVYIEDAKAGSISRYDSVDTFCEDQGINRRWQALEGLSLRYEQDQIRLCESVYFEPAAHYVPKTRVVNHQRFEHSRIVAKVAHKLLAQIADSQPSLASFYGGLSPSIVQTAAMAHDLGHAPFGHVTESLLDCLTRPIGGFSRDLQQQRLLDLQVDAYRKANMPLSARTLVSCARNPWIDPESAGLWDDPPPRISERRLWNPFKWKAAYIHGLYFSEHAKTPFQSFNGRRSDMEQIATPEYEIVRFASDVVDAVNSFTKSLELREAWATLFDSFDSFQSTVLDSIQLPAVVCSKSTGWIKREQEAHCVECSVVDSMKARIAEESLKTTIQEIWNSLRSISYAQVRSNSLIDTRELLIEMITSARVMRSAKPRLKSLSATPVWCSSSLNSNLPLEYPLSLTVPTPSRCGVHLSRGFEVYETTEPSSFAKLSVAILRGLASQVESSQRRESLRNIVGGFKTALLCSELERSLLVRQEVAQDVFMLAKRKLPTQYVEESLQKVESSRSKAGKKHPSAVFLTRFCADFVSMLEEDEVNRLFERVCVKTTGKQRLLNKGAKQTLNTLLKDETVKRIVPREVERKVSCEIVGQPAMR